MASKKELRARLRQFEWAEALFDVTLTVHPQPPE